MINPVEAILSDAEKAKLEHLSQDEVALQALKKVFLFGIYYNGTLRPGVEPNPLMNFALSLDKENIRTNEQLGAILRAATEAVVSVEISFKELEKFRPIIIPRKYDKNPAR